MLAHSKDRMNFERTAEIGMEQGSVPNITSDHNGLNLLSQAYVGRGAAYMEFGKYQNAVEDLDTAIQLDPDNAMAYNNRGIFYQNLGE
jgi:Tfp pilus assembly protein PilF